MRRGLPMVALLLVLLTVCATPTYADSGDSLSTPNSIVVLPGESLSGNITVINPLPQNFSPLVYLGYTVEGNVSINFTAGYFLFKSLNSGESQSFPFSLTVSPDAPPGNYTLLLKFRGMTPEGAIKTLYLRLPVRITLNPIVIRSFDVHVAGRPESVNPFNGEILRATITLENIGAYPTKAILNLSVRGSSGTVFSRSASSIFGPGQETLTFNVPVGWNWTPGDYELEVVVSSMTSRQTLRREFEVSRGVELFNSSISSKTVLAGESLRAYLTVVSERKLPVNVSYLVFSNDSSISERQFPVEISPGTENIQLNLPTNVSGKLEVNASISYDGVVLGSSELSYRVLAYPSLSNVSTRLNGSKLTLLLVINNPNPVQLDAILYYNVSINGTLAYADSMNLQLQPGGIKKELPFFVSPDSNVTYGLALRGEEGTDFGSWRGSIKVPPVQRQSTSSTPQNTSSSSPPGGAEGGGVLWLVGVVVVIILVIAIAFAMGSREEEGYVSPWERARKPRTKPKPKRRSPLGRFKRPKLPKFIENRELPRRFRRRPVAKTKKKKE
ncbi:hypothetical protein [Thermococcus sp. Bubb.Bath]|uniref:hypothetical protein n=1 Tax=Thermococcus sp. Bubb.Bath TaxID=1638242 RepID=UPI0014388137|nr:hypothetical protein [Thermococcus sp. Bubb.Bath]NJF26100.1 hypothetical protein [Thermococcus sp. Bubb.Bath]